MDLRKVVEENPLLAIMRNVPLAKTVDYARAVVAGGVRFFEVALNSPHALEQISMLREALGEDALVGAGTAITVEKAEAAVKAGAQFLLSPSTDRDVLEYCRDQGIAMLPGALTPSDVSACLRYGFSTIKLFPAGDMPKGYIKSLKGPLDGTEYVAIGGVNPGNIGDFFRQGYLGVGLGSSMMPREAVEKGDWAAGTAYVAAMMEEIRQVKNECKKIKESKEK
ncbi:bifunctional 4-hydroxy-2-oxoglutarate aldolase/2-dehydro-3-deoxy-phosphogluconate aldolase [Cuneatibacter caecimuris]|uniref:2-keto-3-deoxy-phosphogluconate aldolase n=1 Tax=Cuneatibacter caecimuris TaxID=1796618 RepID=A0A4Q7PNJ5_9FIRM|nr:bifunctional 4-hydroxy-2-oxoglutarate aldolase/2-dehydro-3-deoxy-phosphogluconate aldolase [Cuneatibacter caecimuris]RZT02539.1 2-keto-3-deoxy-phosphogluconate aldolase [Cuneatibacter caecimuris]